MPFFTMKNQVRHNFLFDMFTLLRGCFPARTERGGVSVPLRFRVAFSRHCLRGEAEGSRLLN